MYRSKRLPMFLDLCAIESYNHTNIAISYICIHQTLYISIIKFGFIIGYTLIYLWIDICPKAMIQQTFGTIVKVCVQYVLNIWLYLSFTNQLLLINSVVNIYVSCWISYFIEDIYYVCFCPLFTVSLSASSFHFTLANIKQVIFHTTVFPSWSLGKKQVKTLPKIMFKMFGCRKERSMNSLLV